MGVKVSGELLGLILGTVVGAVVGAVALGTAAHTGTAIPGLAVALSHIPNTVHGYAVVSSVKSALLGGTGGGAIGAGVSAAAKGAVASGPHTP